MKYVKTLGLAAISAAALMAFAGASTASATVLCTEVPTNEKCPVGSAWTGEIHAVSTEKPVMTTTFKTIECDESTVAWTPEAEGGASATVKGGVEVITFKGNCNCTVVVAQTGTIEIHAITGTNNGTLTSNKATVTVNCSTIFGIVHCNYSTSFKDLGTLIGGNTATMSITTDVERETTNALCNEQATWHAAYKFTTPDALYVATST